VENTGSSFRVTEFGSDYSCTERRYCAGHTAIQRQLQYIQSSGVEGVIRPKRQNKPLFHGVKTQQAGLTDFHQALCLSIFLNTCQENSSVMKI
jgi:hypothetical protein